MTSQLVQTILKSKHWPVSGNTSSIINLVFEDTKFLKEMCDNQFKVHSTIDVPKKNGMDDLVSFFQKKLGKQNCCFKTDRKFYIWYTDGWTVWVNNHAGYSMELNMDKKVTKVKAKKYWRELHSKLIGK